MELRILPNTDIQVSPVCVGTWQFNGGQTSADKTWAALSEEESRKVVDRAIELGVNFFDTAEAYLNSEEVCGRIFAGRRRDVVIATKFAGRVRQYTPEEIERSLLTSLKRLQTDYIDLYQVHWPTLISDDVAGCIAELKRQQSLGRIRSYGVSNFGPKNMKEVIDAGGTPVTNQLPYNLLWRAIEYEIQPICTQHQIGILAYSPLQQGLLTGKFRKPEDVPEGRRRTKLFSSSGNKLSKHGGEGAERQTFEALDKIRAICESENLSMAASSLAWVAQQESVTSLIVGCRNVEQVEANVKLVQLKQETLKQLSEATDALKEHFGHVPDLWAKKSRTN